MFWRLDSLHLQVKPMQLGPIDRASLNLCRGKERGDRERERFILMGTIIHKTVRCGVQRTTINVINLCYTLRKYIWCSMSDKTITSDIFLNNHNRRSLSRYCNAVRCLTKKWPMKLLVPIRCSHMTHCI